MMENWLVRFSHHIVTAVEPDGRAFRAVKTPLSTVFNYPPLAVFETDPPAIAAAAQKYRGRLPIIYQGTMTADRGLFHMIEAVALICRSEPRILLRLIGLQNSDLKKQAVQRVHDLGIQDNVEMTGWLQHQEIAVAMKASLIGLVPLLPNEKYNRALPIKLLEYMACGLPVIAADLPLMARYVRECGGGLLYDSTRPEALASCVLELLADPERRRRMGENSRNAVREHWNWCEMENKLFAIYTSLGACFTEDRV